MSEVKTMVRRVKGVKLEIERVVNRHYDYNSKHKNSRVGKYHYLVNGFSVVRLMDKGYDEKEYSLKYEVLYHHSDTAHFKTFREALEFISDIITGKYHQIHWCECGATWQDPLQRIP